MPIGKTTSLFRILKRFQSPPKNQAIKNILQDSEKEAVHEASSVGDQSMKGNVYQLNELVTMV